MSLFKPSNLTPNFESVIYNQPLTLTFQVNSNGSKVTAYRVQILKDINDDSDSEENIIGTIYGTFDTPLYNKDIGEILLTQETLSYNGINLEPNKDYRWRLRLYGENKRKSSTKTFSVPYTMSIEQRLNAIDFSKDFTIKANNKNKDLVNFYLIISQEDISGILRNMKMYGNNKFNSVNDFLNLLKKNCPKSFCLSAPNIYNNTDHKYPSSFFKNKIHPYMFFYPIGLDPSTLSTDGKYTICYPDDPKIKITDSEGNLLYTFEIEYSQIDYQGYYDEDLTYIGNGMLVGSTKQVMWTPSYDEDMKRNSYARLTWTSGYGTDFQPFKFDTETIEVSNRAEQSITISRSDIKKEYLDNLTNGKYYILLSKDPKPFSSKDKSTYILEQNLLSGSVLKNLRKIVSVKSNYDTEEIDINISGNEDIPNYNTSGYKYLILCYVQQEKIIQVDKGIGSSSLTKILFEEPFDFNPMIIKSPLTEVYGQNIHLGYVSDDFDYDRFYITPVEEFDNSDGFSYIYLFKNTTDAISNSKGVEQSVIDNLISSTNENKKMYKIINYVSSTGEVTIYNKVKFLPTIQTYYQVYKRVATDSGEYKYDLVAGMGLLGGQETNYSSLVCNNSESVQTKIDNSGVYAYVFFDKLFIQPNIGIKEDSYMPMKLEVYNKYLKQSIYLTNYYNGLTDYPGITGKSIEKYYNTTLIDNLDDSMWKVITKNTYSESATLIKDVTTISENLYFPQTQYKIYSNFVDCVPEGFFYSRYDKSIKFEIYDLNTMDSEIEQKVYIVKNGKIYLDDTEVNNIPFRDLYIKTICQDYKIINRIESTDTAFENTNSRFLNGKQYFIGISPNNYLNKTNLKEVKLTNEGGSFKTIGNSAASYGIGYDIKVIPKKKYTVSVNGKNCYISIGLYDLEGCQTRYLSNETEFIPNDGEYFAIIVISSLVQTELTTYSQLKVNNESIISFKEELGINNVPLKEYHYEVMTEDGAVVYSTKETYDGKFYCEFRGCNEDSVYYIKVYVEDNFGKLYTYQAKIPISYDKLTDNTNITITPLCEQQAIKVDFAPIKQIETSGKLVYQEPYIVASSDDDDYPKFCEFDEGKNTINIPKNFSYVMQFELNSSMLDRNEELQLLAIQTDKSAVYILYIDTRPYLINGEIYSLNENYMKFGIKGILTAKGVNKIIGDYTGYSDFVKPTQFAYAISTSSEVN